VRYYIRLRDNPNADDYGDPKALYRFAPETGLAERFDKEALRWMDDPAIIDATGIGGTENFRRVTYGDAVAFARRLTSVVERGGEGSGHFGHEGRPGERGGSAPGTGGGRGNASRVLIGRFGAEAVGKMGDFAVESLSHIREPFGKGTFGYEDLKEIWPLDKPSETVGQDDYWILPNGDAAEVVSHDKTAERIVRFMEQDGLLPGNVSPSGLSANNIDGETFLVGLGLVRWSTSGSRGVSVGQRLTDAQVEAISRMARNTDSVDSLLWESRELEIVDQDGRMFIGSKPDSAGDTLLSLLQERSVVERGGPGSGHRGHAGRPGERGGSAPGSGGGEKARQVRTSGSQESVGLRTYYAREEIGTRPRVPAVQARSARRMEREFAGMDRKRAERSVLYSPDGQVLIDQGGTAWSDAFGASVAYDDEQLAAIRAVPGLILTHNHPVGSSFSDSDLIFAAHNSLAEIRAVGTDGYGRTWLYRFQPGPDAANMAASHIGTLFGQQHQSIYYEWGPRVMAGEATTMWAQENHSHELMTRLAVAEPGLVGYYSRERIDRP
jgi:hypothetical protein